MYRGFNGGGKIIGHTVSIIDEWEFNGTRFCLFCNVMYTAMIKMPDLPLTGSIDSHQHFWYYNPAKHDWVTDDMAVIRKDFLPADLYPLLQANDVAGCVAVQAEQTEEETDFLLKLSDEHSFIKGIVGWVDLASDDLRSRLAYYQQFVKLKGFRHILQGEAPEYMLGPDFLKGISLLQEAGFVYDILIFPQHLTAACELVKQFPDQRFVIDHLAKPYIKSGIIDQWKKDIRSIAQYPNVHCKISGMVTEADFVNWKQADMQPYIDVVVESFGTNRIMYGSDWPVCLVAANYAQTIGIVKKYFSTFSENEQDMFFRKNAEEFYQL